jgi:DNA-binding CsgD family transcriptional regulator
MRGMNEPDQCPHKLTLGDRDDSIGVALRLRVDRLCVDRRLTMRQGELLRALVLDGGDLDCAAKEMRISRRTAKFHLVGVCSKLGADSRVDIFRVVLNG